VDEQRQATLEIIVRALVTTIVGRSDMQLGALRMLRDQALATLDREDTIKAGERERLRASVEEFFRDVAESVATPPNKNSN
jgi:hypothetical protein